MHQIEPGTETAKGDPSKSLFISMLTRDISLADCIVDLLDNSVDGIKEFRKRTNLPVPAENEYAGYWVKIEMRENQFRISDNCGGIPIQVAKDYAFRFGRRDQEDQQLAESHTIGLYGIGMKRAMFKMGKQILVTSSTGTESFRMALDVDQWRRQRDPQDNTRDNWDFELTHVVRNNTNVPSGTSIEISELPRNVSRDLSSPGFENGLIYSLRRQYAFIISNGLHLTINGHAVTPIMPTFKVGDQIAPMRLREEHNGVTLDITAGLASSPPEDDSAENLYPAADTYGWYVACNDRIVVTADKTFLTGWGVTPVPNWHPQFYGFLGVVRFDANDPRLLPWTTTKRYVDTGSEIYRYALTIMSECAKQFVDYTNKRKGEITQLKRIEGAAVSRSITKVDLQKKMSFPKIGKTKTRRIQYDKPLSEIEAVAKALKMRRLSLKEIGIKTFDYFKEREVV
jgi:hypothetical protein